MFQSGIRCRNTTFKGYYQKERGFKRYIIHETLIKIGSELMVMGCYRGGKWVKSHLLQRFFKKIIVTEQFLSNIVRNYGKQPLPYRTLFPRARKFLKLNDHAHSSFERRLIKG